MSSNAFFSDLLTSISERGRNLLRRAGSSDGKQDASDLIELCEALLSGRGEASGTAMAREVLDRYQHLDEAAGSRSSQRWPATTVRTGKGWRRRSRAGARSQTRTTPAIFILPPNRGDRS